MCYNTIWKRKDGLAILHNFNTIRSCLLRRNLLYRLNAEPHIIFILNEHIAITTSGIFVPLNSVTGICSKSTLSYINRNSSRNTNRTKKCYNIISQRNGRSINTKAITAISCIKAINNTFSELNRPIICFCIDTLI